MPYSLPSLRTAVAIRSAAGPSLHSSHLLLLVLLLKHQPCLGRADQVGRLPTSHGVRRRSIIADQTADRKIPQIPHPRILPSAHSGHDSVRGLVRAHRCGMPRL